MLLYQKRTFCKVYLYAIYALSKAMLVKQCLYLNQRDNNQLTFLNCILRCFLLRFWAFFSFKKDIFCTFDRTSNFIQCFCNNGILSITHYDIMNDITSDLLSSFVVFLWIYSWIHIWTNKPELARLFLILFTWIRWVIYNVHYKNSNISSSC